MNLNRLYKTNLKHDFAEGLEKLIGQLLEQSPEGDDDKLHLAVLAKIKERLYQKLGHFRTDYTMSFSPYEALALRMLYQDYVMEPHTYMGNKLHSMAVEVHQLYNR